MFTYDCPHCGNELEGSFGDDLYCYKCDKSYETDYELNIAEDWDESYSAWLTGVERPGRDGASSKTMPPEFKKYYVQELEWTTSDSKKVTILLNVADLGEAWEFLMNLAFRNRKEARYYQITEREDTGVLFVRASVVLDGREFCKSPEEMGPDKFGYI